MSFSGPIEVASPNVTYTAETITTNYEYRTTDVSFEESKDGARRLVATPNVSTYQFKTQRAVPRMGLMIVGWGGNNGTTVTGGVIANREGISWNTKAGVQNPNYFGSITQASTVNVGTHGGADVFVPFSSLLPMVQPNDLVIGGWDINNMNLGDAMGRAEVFHVDLQRKLYSHMKDLVPLPSVYVPDFIAANQAERANNVLSGTRQEQVEELRRNIREFKATNGLDKVIVLWSANTERFCDVTAGVHDTADNILGAIESNHDEIAPSVMFAVASILEGSSFINGSPQNTVLPGVIDLATRHNVFVGGDDFKSGQTKMKSVLVDFLVSAGIKPVSIVSYNHLGNNDGHNLSAPKQFRSKEISKSNVVDDMVASNRLLYKAGEHPDHVVVIKYVPAVKDSKRALDEYTSEIFMGGMNTISLHNTCEDSLLAAPLILDLALLTELCERISITPVTGTPARFHSVLSILSYLLKAPMVPPGTPVVNALFKQREAVVNIMRACIGLAPENFMQLENRLDTASAVRTGAGAAGAGAVPVTGSAPVKAAPVVAAGETDGKAQEVTAA